MQPSATLGDDGRVVTTPHLHGDVDEVGRRGAHQRDPCAEATARLVAPRVAAHDHVADEEKPGEQHQGQARLPGPIGAPSRLGPQGTGHQDDEAEEDAYLGQGEGEPLRLRAEDPVSRRPPHEQVPRRGEGARQEADKRGHRAPDVEVEDLVDHPHLLLRRGAPEDEV